MGLLSRITALFSSLSNTQYPWPALDIVLPGDRHLHLVGSIHMGTRDMAPLSSKLIDKLNNSDALIVEADISEGGSPFPSNPDELPLEERLSADNWAQIMSLIQELGIPLSQIDNQPAWQIALVLQAYQAQRLGLRADFGIDFQLLEAAKVQAVPIIELEGAEHQVDILTRLPDGGMPLLTDTLTHWHTNARLLQTMISWWLESPPQSGKVGKCSFPIHLAMSYTMFLCINVTFSGCISCSNFQPDATLWQSEHCIFTVREICQGF